MNDAPKPEEDIKPNVPSDDGEAGKKSEVKATSTPDGKKSEKVVFNGREYDSIIAAEEDHKKLQTAYQKEKAERERLEAEKSQEPEDDDYLKALFGDSEPTPQPQVPPAAPTVDRDKIRLSLLVAERDPKKAYFKDVANDVAKILASDQMIMAVAGIGQTDKAVDLAYSKAVAARIDSLKKAEYDRGREEALREAAKPNLAPADDKIAPPPPVRELKDMSLKEMEAFLPKADPRY